MRGAANLSQIRLSLIYTPWAASMAYTSDRNVRGLCDDSDGGRIRRPLLASSQTRHSTWLTPRRMRAATAAVFAIAICVSSIGLSGSTSAPAQSRHHAAAPATSHPR